MLSETSTRLFITLHPVYFLFNTRFNASVSPEATLYSNVPNLAYEDIFNLAEKDVNTEGSIIVLKKRKYQGYVNWFLKNKAIDNKVGAVKMNLRMSPHNLDTRLMTKQYILLLRRYNPFIEDLNRFLLIVEVLHLL